MSVRHISAAIDAPLAPNHFAVLVVIGDSTNKDDNLSWLSVESIAQGTGYSERQTKDILKELRKLRLLTRVKAEDVPQSALDRGLMSIPKNRRPSVYRFNLEMLGVRELHPTGVRDAAARGAGRRGSGVRPTAPKPLREPKRTADQDSIDESQDRADPEMVRGIVAGFRDAHE